MSLSSLDAKTRKSSWCFFFLLELPHKDIIFIDDINAEAAKVSEPLSAILPVHRQVVRLHMSQCQSELPPRFFARLPADYVTRPGIHRRSQCRWLAVRSNPLINVGIEPAI